MSFECSVGDWHRKKDPVTGAYYYANSRTLASSWTVPPGWQEPPAPEGAPPPLTVAESWREVTDPVTGHIYYVNTMTMESSWTKPAAMEEPSRNGKPARPTQLDMPSEDPETSDDDHVQHIKKSDSHSSFYDHNSHLKKSDSHSSSFYEEKKGEKPESSPRLRQAAALASTPWVPSNGEDIRERIHAIKALLADENAYYADLQLIGLEFETILQIQKANGKEGLNPLELKTVLKNIPDLLALHSSFAQGVAEFKTDAQILSSDLCRHLHQLLTSLEPPYASYLSSNKNWKSLLAFIDRLEGERPGFKTTLEIIKAGKCKSGIAKPFQYYLEAPFSRAAAYGNLILNVLKTMEPNGEGFKLWNDLLELSESVTVHVEQSAQFIAARDAVADIQKRLHFVNASETGLKLVTPTRFLVQSGEVKKKLIKRRLGSSYKTYMLYVFNDMVMYTSVPDKLKRVVPKRCMPMLGMKVLASTKDVNFTIASIIKNVQFKAATKEARDKWVRVLQEWIKRAIDASIARSTSKPISMAHPGRGW